MRLACTCPAPPRSHAVAPPPQVTCSGVESSDGVPESSDGVQFDAESDPSLPSDGVAASDDCMVENNVHGGGATNTLGVARWSSHELSARPAHVFRSMVLGA